MEMGNGRVDVKSMRCAVTAISEERQNGQLPFVSTVVTGKD